MINLRGKDRGSAQSRSSSMQIIVSLVIGMHNQIQYQYNSVSIIIDTSTAQKNLTVLDIDLSVQKWYKSKICNIYFEHFKIFI